MKLGESLSPKQKYKIMRAFNRSERQLYDLLSNIDANGLVPHATEIYQIIFKTTSIKLAELLLDISDYIRAIALNNDNIEFQNLNKEAQSLGIDRNISLLEEYPSISQTYKEFGFDAKQLFGSIDNAKIIKGVIGELTMISAWYRRVQIWLSIEDNDDQGLISLITDARREHKAVITGDRYFSAKTFLILKKLGVTKDVNPDGEIITIYDKDGNPIGSRNINGRYILHLNGGNNGKVCFSSELIVDLERYRQDDVSFFFMTGYILEQSQTMNLL